MDTTGNAAAPAIVGVADTRSITLDRLAGEHAPAVAENLRRVLPSGEEGRLPMCGFQSSI
jgi:FXSXX-COOH protein